MIELILQALGELLLELLLEVLLELGFHALREPTRPVPNPVVAVIGFASFGAILGGASLLVLPEYFMPPGPWRLANLLLSPILVGLLMAALGSWRARRGQPVFRIDRFTYGFLFAFSLALVRYLFAI